MSADLPFPRGAGNRIFYFESNYNLTCTQCQVVYNQA